jgi:hypothetical protein
LASAESPYGSNVGSAHYPDTLFSKRKRSTNPYIDNPYIDNPYIDNPYRGAIQARDRFRNTNQ